MGAFALLTVAAVLLIGVGFAFFLRLERNNDQHVAVLLLVVLLFVTQLLHPNESDTVLGLFRIPAGPIDLRPTDLIVTGAIAAKLLVARPPARISRSALLWIAFTVWYGVAAVLGFLNGAETSEVIFQGRLVISGIGVLVVVSSCDIGKLIAKDRISRMGRVVGLATAALVVTHLSQLSYTLDAPIVGFSDLGALGGDVRTMLPFFGVAALLHEVSSGQRRLTVLLPSVVMIGSPFVSSTAGPYLSLFAGASVALVVATGRTWSRRTNLTASDVVFAVLGLVGVAALSLFLSGGSSPVFVEQFEDAVLSDSQDTTTGERVQLWDEATERIVASPIWGEGLGAKGTIVRPWPLRAAVATFHNVGFDLAVRSGLVGLALFGLAMGSTLFDARKVWLLHPDNVAATLALASMLAIVGLMSRAMVSSAFERSRFTVALFLAVGLVFALRREYEAGLVADQMKRTIETDTRPRLPVGELL
ncbi:MAG: O-antigen ligase family protein [Actinobacteria bacterium]|nr:O-antigen ligase family protein [Actinomycetota bacterium]